MSKRIIFSRRRYHDPTAGLPFEELGGIEEGRWGLLPDEAILAAGFKGQRLPILFFSKEDYEHAIRRLEPWAIAKVIRKRLEFWSNRALDDGLDQIYRGERQALVFAALASGGASPAQESPMLRRFEESLDLLANVVGGSRCVDLKPVEMLILLLRGETKLLKENQIAEEAARTWKNRLLLELASASVQRGRRRTEMLCSAIAGMGRPEFRQALPYIEIERVLYIKPYDEELAAALKMRDIPMMELLDGLVAVWPLRKMEELVASGNTNEIVCFSAGEFIEDLNTFTTEQLARDCQQRSEEAYGKSQAPFMEYLNMLALEQALLRKNVLAAVPPAGDLAAALREHVLEDTRELKARLAQSPSWLNRRPVQAGEAASLLESANRLVEQDVAFFEELSRRSKRPGLRARFAYIRQIKMRHSAFPA